MVARHRKEESVSRHIVPGEHDAAVPSPVGCRGLTDGRFECDLSRGHKPPCYNDAERARAAAAPSGAAAMREAAADLVEDGGEHLALVDIIRKHGEDGAVDASHEIREKIAAAIRALPIAEPPMPADLAAIRERADGGPQLVPDTPKPDGACERCGRAFPYYGPNPGKCPQGFGGILCSDGKWASGSPEARRKSHDGWRKEEGDRAFIEAMRTDVPRVLVALTEPTASEP